MAWPSRQISSVPCDSSAEGNPPTSHHGDGGTLLHEEIARGRPKNHMQDNFLVDTVALAVASSCAVQRKDKREADVGHHSASFAISPRSLEPFAADEVES